VPRVEGDPFPRVEVVAHVEAGRRLGQVRVVLASASPRRRELLNLVGIAHEARPAGVDETLFDGESPTAHAERLALAKAHAISGTEPDALVLAADTIVVVDDRILGKPRDAGEAREMLVALSGRTHTVVTGVAAAYRQQAHSDVEQVAVTFRPLSAEDIRAYIATGEPMDKAGAYGIQGYGATIVERIDGDYFAVMGLAIVRLLRLCAKLGFTYQFNGLFPDEAMP
jgi:septum formation protein